MELLKEITCGIPENILIAIISLCGVLLGAIITTVFTFILNEIKSKNEEKLYLKRRKEEVYLEIISILRNFRATIKPNSEKIPPTLQTQANDLVPKLALYSPKKIKKDYQNLLVDYVNLAIKGVEVPYDKEEELLRKIKNDLNIEEKINA